jgi:hypothetical protein
MNRVLGSTPKPTASAIRDLRRMALKLGSRLPQVHQEEYGIFALKYHGAKRARYLQAAELVKQYGVRPRDARITMFVKPDRINPFEKRNPDPRAIQFRDPIYCVGLASYLKPIEPHLYALKYKNKYLGKTRLIAKGLNQLERARLLLRKWRRFLNPTCRTIDAHRFDKHCHTPLLRAEHLVYLRCLYDPDFKRLLKLQLRNYGFTDEEIAYITDGLRMSGDMNTALGNCGLMILITLVTFLPLKVPFDILDDGDDCLILCDASHAPRINAAILTMTRFGMIIRIENETNIFEKIVFCQSQPIFTAHGPKFVRNPMKVMSHSLVGLKWSTLNERGRRTYLNGVAECETILNQGVPVLHSFGQALRRNANTSRLAFDESAGDYFRLIRELKSTRADAVVPITDATRCSFHKAFGIDPSTQVDWEARLDSWSFSLTGDMTEFAHFDPTTWEDQRVWVDPIY